MACPRWLLKWELGDFYAEPATAVEPTLRLCVGDSVILVVSTERHRFGVEQVRVRRVFEVDDEKPSSGCKVIRKAADHTIPVLDVVEGQLAEYEFELLV